jgi:hypothetical protein
MCTLTIIPIDGGIRLMVNRDEERTRPAALPPRELERAGARAVMPVDPQSGGTWVAASQSRFAASLLNYNPGASLSRRAKHGAASRGLIIPAIAHEQGHGTAVEAAMGYDVRETPPFRLVIVSVRGVTEITSPGYGAPRVVREHEPNRPLMFASSGLGDDLVDPPRRALLRELFAGASTTWPDAQIAFHAHQWPAKPELSVRMERADARTVSRTTVVIGPDGCTMTYEPISATQVTL